MQRVSAVGRSTKVLLSAYRIGQVPRRARAWLESWDAPSLSGALPWSLCSLSWPPGSGVSSLFSWLSPLSGVWSGYLRGFGYWMRSPWCVEAGRLLQDGLPYELYLRLPRLFVPILTDMFNHWFAQGAIRCGLAWCTTTRRWWCRWTGSARRCSRSSGRSVGLPPVSSSLYPRFGASAPEA